MWCHDRTRIDDLAAEIASYDRDELIDKLIHFPSRTTLDFTHEYLDDLSTEQLQHILLCAMTYLPPDVPSHQ